MNVESKLKFRIGLIAVAAVSLLAFLVGTVYALAISLLAFLLWKAYSKIKLLQWWKKQSATTRQLSDFISERLNEGSTSKNLWVQSLAVPELAQTNVDYRVELMARPMVIEKQSPSNLIEGWVEWASLRLDECVFSHDTESLGKNMSHSESNPIPLLHIMVAKAALEITVAEQALRLLGASNPRQLVSQRTLEKHLEAQTSEMDIAWAFKSNSMMITMDLLARELGEVR